MQGMYNYIPKTTHVSRVRSVAAGTYNVSSPVEGLVLLHQYFPKCAVPSIAVFCSSFISCFPGMLFRHYLNDEVVPVASIITGITLFLHPIIIIMFKNETMQ
jgi:hypothetical protein